jgi:Holliday junction resolvase
MKKGYLTEWEVKKILHKKFSPDNVFKIAIGGSLDFCIIDKNGKVIKLIEVKTTKKKKWYPTQREKKQFFKLLRFQKKLKVKVEYWIKIKRVWHIFSLKELKKEIMKK